MRQIRRLNETASVWKEGEITLSAPFTAVWLSLSALLLLTGGCSGNDPQAPATGKKVSSATPAIVVPVVMEPEQVRLEAVGTSRARHSILLHPATAGEVTAVNFTAGQQVAKGDVLVQLDDRDQQLAVQLARVRLEEARRLLRRYRESQGSGAITASDLDSARSAVEATRIELNRAQVALDDRSVEAPFAGVVGVTDIDPGARITPETTITSLDDRSVLLVRFDVPETLADRLALGDPVSIAPWTGRGGAVAGRIIDIGSRIDPVSRTFPVRAEVSNLDDRLRPGMSFRVKLELDGPAYPVVPEVSVQWGGAGSYIWKVDARQAMRVPVTIVQRREGRVLVDADLAPGDLVVREGVQRMRDGLSVSYREPKAS